MNCALDIYYHDTEFKLSNEKKYREWIDLVISHVNLDITSINYIFSNDAYILELNKAHLAHDYYTDILTFVIENEPLQAEIYISIDRIKDNAEQLNIDFNKELLRVMAHGLLHLAGFDDHSEQDVILIRSKEEEAIALW